MASEQDDAVFDHSLDDDDDDESQSQEDDDLENDDVLVNDNDDVLIEDDEEEEEEEEELNSPSTSSPITTTTTVATISVKPAVTVAVPIATPSISAVTIAAVPNGNEPGPDPKRPRIGETLIVQQEEKKPAPFDESRRLFQRLWTDEDEIELLQGFLDYTTTRGSGGGGGGHHHHNDTALFYDQIKSKLQLDFNKNQLVEKLRRLKKKYRNVIGKISSGKDFSFKTAHDQATFEISRKIWSNSNSNNNNNNGAASALKGGDDTVLDDEEVNLNPSFSNLEVKSEDFVIEKKTTAPRSRKRSRSKSGVKIDEIVTNVSNENIHNNSGGGGGVVEETVRSCLTPLFKELLSGAMMMGGGGGGGGGGCGGRGGIGGLAMNAMPLSFGMPAMMMSFGGGSGEVVDERWRKQQILELEVYSKRLELVQDQIKVALEDLRNMGG